MIVSGVREIARPEQKMVAIGKENGPTMGLILRSANAFGDIRQAGAIGIDALQRALGVGRKKDDAFASPTAAARRQSAGQILRRATRDRDLLKFAVREKSHIRAVRRPERITCPLRTRQWRHVRGA